MIEVAVIGAGRIGQIHALNVFQNTSANIRYVIDVYESAAQDLAEKCGAAVCSVDEALADAKVDAVVIASSTDTHAELIAQAARAGKAIFCEKPLDLEVGNARKSLQVVTEHDGLLCLGFNRRHDPTFNQLKQEVDAGAVGNVEIVSITSRDPTPPPVEYIKRSGGLFHDMMIHDFDMARWLLGEEPIEIFANASVMVDEQIGVAGDVDTAIVIMKTASGRLCQINNSRRCEYGYDQRIEVFGSDGMLRAGNQSATQIERANKQGFSRDPALYFFLERYAEAYKLQLDKFLSKVGGKDIELPGGHDGLRALQIADAAQLSFDTGKSVSLSE